MQVEEMPDSTSFDKLIELRSQYGENAEFVSKDGFSFNAFDDVWTLNALGRTGEKVVWEDRFNKKFSLEDQIVLRLAVANYAKTRAASTVYSLTNWLHRTNLQNLELTELKTIVLEDNGEARRFVKTLVQVCHRIDSERFNQIYEWSRKLEISNYKPSIFDVERGAFSDLENNAINVAMNQRFIALQNDGFDPASSKNSGISYVQKAQNFIAARLTLILGRRPSNLIQLKWMDILPRGIPFESSDYTEYPNHSSNVDDYFVDDDELHIRMFLAKHKNRFREAVESSPLALNHLLSREVMWYRQGYFSFFKAHLKSQNITMSHSEMDKIFSRCPLFFHSSLFDTHFLNKKNLFEAITANGSGFHYDSTTLNANIRNMFKSLLVCSERLPKDKFKIGNNRIRHTIGTNAARDNLHVAVIAKQLGNTVGAARIYIDMSDEVRAEIDRKFVGNETLLKAFSNEISVRLDGTEILIIDTSGEIVGKPKSVNTCLTCTRKKPIGCYGCNNFKALVTANHKLYLEEAKKLYQLRLDIGQQEKTLVELKKQIRYIEVTIEVCDRFLSLEGASHDK